MFRSYKSVTYITNKTTFKLCSYTRCCYFWWKCSESTFAYSALSARRFNRLRKVGVGISMSQSPFRPSRQHASLPRARRTFLLCGSSKSYSVSIHFIFLIDSFYSLTSNMMKAVHFFINLTFHCLTWFIYNHLEVIPFMRDRFYYKIDTFDKEKRGDTSYVT